MKIKTIANIAWLASLLVVFGVGAAVYLAGKKNAAAARKDVLSAEIAREFTERNTMFGAYLRKPRQEIIIESQLLYDASMEKLQSKEFNSTEEQIILEDMRESNAGMRQIFASLIALRDPQLARDLSDVARAAEEERLASTFQTLSIKAIDGARRLEAISEGDRSLAVRWSNVVTLTAVALMTTMGMFNIGILSMRVVRPLTRMSEATSSIAQGNFSHRVGLSSKDELGALARSFDDMAQSLQSLQSELQAKVHDLRLIMEAMPVGVIYFGTDTRYRFCNPLYASWAGRPAEEIVGRTIREVVGERYYSIIQGSLSASLAGERVRVDWRLPFADRERDVHIEAIPDIDDANVRGCTVIMTDVSDIVAAHKQLETAKTAADQANMAKSTFLASVSHELRTPIGVMLGYAEIILSEGATPEVRDAAEIILRNGHNLLSLLNDILDLSKVEAGRLEFHRRSVALGPLIYEVVQLLRIKANEKGLKLLTRVQVGVPATIVTDDLRLRQILTNVIGNAIKFTSQGEVRITVRTTNRPQRSLEILVEDTGIGISPESAGRIFEPFTQAEGYITRRFGGTGLGLTLSRELANALGGDVALIASEVGVGSVFAVHVDMGQVDATIPMLRDADVAPLRSAANAELDFERLNGVKILLVEDSPEMQALLKAVLSSRGAVVDVASDGKAGIGQALAAPHDVVLMDIQMPVMDGYTAIAKLRALGYDGPVIALTAHAMTGEAERCRAAGFTDYVAKPVNRQRLFEMVEKYGKHTPISPIRSERPREADSI